MTQYLPHPMLALFQPRPPIPYMPPVERKNKLAPYHGIAQYLPEFETPSGEPYVPPPKPETKKEKKEREEREREEKDNQKIAEEIEKWDPHNNQKATEDPFRTLFVSRIAYDVTERQLKREFEDYGSVKNVVLVRDKTEKSRGYAFIEFREERDMLNAYKRADGRKINGCRVLVDVERGRTVKGWRPRRLNGGLGETRKGGDDVNQKYSGREQPSNYNNDMKVNERERESGGGAGGGYKERRVRERPRDQPYRRERSRSRERKTRASRDRNDRDRGDRGGDRGMERGFLRRDDFRMRDRGRDFGERY